MAFQGASSFIPGVKEASPVSSCVSMKSDSSMDPPVAFQKESLLIPGPIQPERANTSAPSCVSLKSAWSMEQPIRLEKTPCFSENIPIQQERSITSEPSSVSFKSNRNQQSNGTSLTATKMTETGGSAEESFSAHDPQMFTSLNENELCTKFKASLKDRFQLLHDGLQSHGHSRALNDIYTELYIMRGGRGEINNEHEVRQIEISSKMKWLEEDTPIKCNDIFEPSLGQDGTVKTVLTQGVAGIGKTVSVHKFILDWAEGNANQHVDFMFPLAFRELNLLDGHLISLEALVHNFFPHIKETNFANLESRNVLFIFDGLDECRLLLDFKMSVPEYDVTRATSVNVLLTNLIKGNLFPSAFVWITSRPAAASQIPSEFISQLTEIRGFTDPQKEEYFQRKITDQGLANKIITHLKASRSLHIMCHIPVFCWISATVLEDMLQEAGDTAIPKNLTQMYTHFLIIQTSVSKKKYTQSQHVDKEMILKLGKLAFQQLLKGNLIFYTEDLRDCGINVSDAIEYSGICTQIFREEFELLYSKGKVFCFVHLSIQEYLAALYVKMTFIEQQKALLWDSLKQPITLSCSTMADLHQNAVDKALQAKNGQFDLFLRFLLGLSQESNQGLLQSLLPQISVCNSQTICDTVEYIKVRLRMTLPPEKYINLFHCLNELNDFSLEEEIQNVKGLTKLSTSQWSALVFVLLTSGSDLDVFDPWKYTKDNPEQCLWRLLPVLTASRTAHIRNINLTNKGFRALASAISSKTTSLRELKLSGEAMHSHDIANLAEGLRSSHCKLEVLELSECAIDAKCCTILASALNSNPSHLRELNLNFNHLVVYGLRKFSHVLQNPHARLETLKLVGCNLENKGCVCLAAALAATSRLKELDLSKNPLRDSGVAILSDGLKNPLCKLKILRLTDCSITTCGCRSLCTALESNPCYLIELCLNRNPLLDEGILFISNFLKIHHCKLEKLSLSFCSVSEKGGDALIQALELNPSYLRALELTGNKLGSTTKQKLSALQQHQDFRLEKLSL